MSTPSISLVRKHALLRALHLRCPQCGEGRLMRSYASLETNCPHCDLRYRRELGAETGSMYLSAAVTQVFAVFLVGAIWIFTDWGTTLSISVGAPIVFLFCAFVLPFSQAIWVAAEYSTDFVNREDWIEPRL